MTSKQILIYIVAGYLIWTVLAIAVAIYGRSLGYPWCPLLLCGLTIGAPLVLLAVTIGSGPRLLRRQNTVARVPEHFTDSVRKPPNVAGRPRTF